MELAFLLADPWVEALQFVQVVASLLVVVLTVSVSPVVVLVAA